MAVARDTGNAHHLARTDLQIDGLEVHAKLVLSRQVQAPHRQARRSRLARVVHQLGRFGANHQARQGRIGFFGRVAHSRDLAATQHGAGGAQGADFMELMADVHNAAALGSQLLQHHKQFFHRLRCEHRGGFIQYE